MMLNLAIDKLLVIKVEIRDIKINITDNVTTPTPRVISLRIERIVSFGCDSSWQEVPQVDKNELGKVFRNTKIIKLNVLILKENEEFDLDESNNKSHLYIKPLLILLFV